VKRLQKAAVVSSASVAVVLALVGSAAVNAQAALKTADGVPDLQGTWSFATLTPFERPASLAGKEYFTPKEAEDFEKATLDGRNMDTREGGASQDVERAYNDFWWDFGSKVVWTRRTSLVIDPPDGRIPTMTEAGRQRLMESFSAFRNDAEHLDGPEQRPLPERCLILQGAGPPVTPTAYNNNVQIVQSPGFVVMLVEMGHEVRIFPTDGRPHIPSNVKQWKGDSRGRWDGDTLAVETTNMSTTNAFRGASPNMKLTERLRRVDKDKLLYQFTVDDPETWTKPWTVEIPLTTSDGRLFEYACHEGNRGMENVLAGARAAEKAQTNR
jgi:hypothetical protein